MVGSHAKCERVSRHLEAIYEPDNILLGRHQAAVINALRADGYNEIADKVEKAHPPGATPENRTPPLTIEQPAKAAGIDLREIGKVVRELYYNTNDRDEFSAALAEHGLTLAVSDRAEKPAWVIRGGPDGSFINTLSRCLPGVSRAPIHITLGEPNDDTGRGQQQRDAAAPDLGGYPGDPQAPAQHDQNDDRASARPVVDDDARAAQVFVHALNEAQPEVFDGLLSRASDLARSAIAHVLQYFRDVERRARAWLEKNQTALKPPRPDKLLEEDAGEGR